MTASSPLRPAERLYPTESWETGLLRVTAFCLNPPDLSTIKWWENLAGCPAETRNVRVGIGQLVEQGPLDDSILQLQINLGKVDWLLFPKNQPENETFGTLGDFEQSTKYFVALVSKWLAESSPLNRLAYGASLFISTTGQQEAVVQMQRILPSLGTDWNNIQDFAYQVNRPRLSIAWPELGSINRIAKWQVVLRQTVVANLLPQLQAPFSLKSQTAVDLEIDVNTSPLTETMKELPRDNLGGILKELAENALEIASKGDVK